MADLVPRKQHDMAQVERAEDRMRDTTEFGNLKADIRMSRGRELKMPWKTGRALRSAGMDEATGLPKTPLAVLNLQELVTDSEKGALQRDMDRVLAQDAIMLGSIDRLHQTGTPTHQENAWWEDNIQDQADAKEVQKQLESPKLPEFPVDHLPEGSH